jgi:hypothetical protein
LFGLVTKTCPLKKTNPVAVRTLGRVIRVTLQKTNLPLDTGPVRLGNMAYSRKSKKASSKSKGSKICPEGKAWAQRTFDTYPSAYANMAASKYCKDPNYAKKSKGGKRKGS